MEEEILACIDNKNLKYLQSGQISKYIFPMERKEAHSKNIGHLIVRVFIMTITSDNQILYLVQKRGKNKGYPGHYTDSASGHVIYKEKLNMADIKENAIRELEEEFGIPPKSIRSFLFRDLNIETDKFTGEIAYIFFGLIDNNVELHPDSSELEIEGSQFYSKIELKKLLAEEKSIFYSKKIWKKLLKTDIFKLFEKKLKLDDIDNVDDTALFIGRFQPFHLGHLHVIENILKNHKKVKIGIGSSQSSHTKNDPFTCDERKQFITSTLKSKGIQPQNYEIFEIPDIFNAKKWISHVISITGKINIIYSNSDWVRQLFQNKEYEIADKIIIDMNKFNATNIRNLIYNDNMKWTSLVPKEVFNLIKKFEGIERIKNLNKSL